MSDKVAAAGSLPSEDFRVVLAVFSKSINSALDNIGNTGDIDFKKRTISNLQAAEANKRIMDWQAGSKVISRGQLRDVDKRILSYRLSNLYVNITAYKYAHQSICTLIINAMLDAFSNAQFTIACLLLRALIECIAIGHWLVKRITSICDIEIRANDDFWASFQSMTYLDSVNKALYGTRSDWLALAQGNFRTMKDQDALYQEIGGFISREVTNMLTRVKALSRAVPGITIAYGVLCEFSHPNVGDLFASTKSYELSVDRDGIIHHSRVLGDRAFSPEENPDFAVVLTKTLDVCSDLSSVLIEISANMSAIMLINLPASEPA